ncbi:MAG TPA: protein translocase subunit SecF [Candidatus Sulfotelmatobacter sp.]|jgi:preprotein translocase subunit SecF|nr:protein translocase subunit SecF [Candidatus Sulfotelmatobacter sp.]
MNIVGKRNWYFAFSLIIIIPGVISLFLWGLTLSIDFTGGSQMILVYPQKVNEQIITNIKKTFVQEKVSIVSLQQQSSNQVFVRTKPMDDKQDSKFLQDLKKNTGNVRQDQFETIGPVIGKEITVNAFNAIVIASLLIVLYIAWAFRGVRKPASSWRFGVCAIIALLHDALVVVGIFSLLGHFFGIEVDSLFVTALLTVIGFSVHDTIVVFDRIRENLRRNITATFPQVVNDSILQTLVRSLNTSLTAMLVLFTLLIFGGTSIRWFVVAMLIGIVSGTYSSIFNASQLLVVWQERIEKRNTKGRK